MSNILLLNPITASEKRCLTLSRIFTSLLHPRLLSSVLLIEPYIAVAPRVVEGGKMIALASLRRDIWPSRKDAVQKARRVLKAWDERVLQRWAHFAYRELPTAIYASPQAGAVTLATTKHQEAMTYTYIRPGAHTSVLPGETAGEKVVGARPKRRVYGSEPLLAMKSLPHIAPSVLIVSGSTSSLYSDGSHTNGARVTGTKFGGNGGMDAGRVRHEVIEQAGHAVPFEKVVETASVAGSWIAREIVQWQHNEDKLSKEWSGLPLEEKTTLSKEWLELARTLPGVKERSKI